MSPDGKSVDFKPELAREWEIQGDRIHVFRLHKGVTFHNGDPLTSADVKWNLERVKDKSQSPIHAWKLELLEAIETPDPLTVKLHFTKPYPFLRVAFTGSTGRAATILNPRAVKEKGKTYGRNPVGTGPFKFAEWKEGDYILLEKNPSYWETDASGGKLPYLDKVLIKIIIEPSTLVAALKTGEVDLINNVQPQFVADLKKDPKLTALTAVGGNWRCLHFNLAKEPFNDKALRKAVTFAIDRKELLDKVQFGEGIVAHGPISPPMGAFYDPGLRDGQERAVLRPRAGEDLDEAGQVRRPGGPVPQHQRERATRAPRRWSRRSSPRSAIKVRIELADFPTFRRRWLQETPVGPRAGPVGRRPRPRRDALPRAALDGDVERGQVGEQGLRQGRRAGARGERLQEAEEVLRRLREGHPGRRAGGHHAPRQRAEDPPQVREGLPDDSRGPDRHAPRLARPGLKGPGGNGVPGAARPGDADSPRTGGPLANTCVLTPVMIDISIGIMTTGRRITANLPEGLLEEAMEVTGKGITETLVEGLRLVRRARAYEKAMALRGKVNLSIDLDASRERRRR